PKSSASDQREHPDTHAHQPRDQQLQLAHRSMVEQAIATLKSWRLLRKRRCSTTRVTSPVQAVLVLQLTATG
ncbi:hypothetical protein ABZ758_46685, partial [Streptomyces sp. NPDC006668]